MNKNKEQVDYSVVDIVQEWLLWHSFDGLYNGKKGCYCQGVELLQCNALDADCRLGHRQLKGGLGPRMEFKNEE
jgi:hypothetical protein